MSAAPEISIVIPTWNRAPLLERAIDSCLTQEGVALELVVVDDASTDATPELLARYRERLGERMRTIRLDANHGSGGVARNVGKRAATGTWLKFLDHDDVLEPGTLAAELALARESDADLVLSGWGVRAIDGDGAPVTGSERRYEPPELDRLVDAIVRREKVPYTAAVLYRRAALDGIDWDPAVAIIDDFDFFCRSALSTRKLARRTGLAYWWQRNPDSIQGRQERNPLGYLDSAYVEEKIFRRIEELLDRRGELTASRREAIAGVYYRSARTLARFDPPKGREVLAAIERLVPGYRPDARAEGGALLRAFAGVFGTRAVVRGVAAVKRVGDRIAPPAGWLSFKGERP